MPNRTNDPLVCSTDLISNGHPQLGWLVDELIPKGNLVMIVAPPATFKTWTAISMGKAVAEGELFLGRKTLQKRVLYIDRENPASVLSERLKTIGASPNFFFFPLWKDPPPLDSGFKEYENLAGPDDFVIFDSLIRFHSSDEDKAGGRGMSPALNALRNLTLNGATVLYLHHQGKDWRKGYRGTTDILAACDIAFSIYKKQKDPILLELKAIKNRYGAESDLTLRVEITESTFSMEDVTGQERKKDFLKLQDVIKSLNQKLGALPKQGQIVDEGMRRGFAKSDVFDLLRDGEGQYWSVTGQKPKLYAAI